MAPEFLRPMVMRGIVISEWRPPGWHDPSAGTVGCQLLSAALARSWVCRQTRLCLPTRAERYPNLDCTSENALAGESCPGPGGVFIEETRAAAFLRKSAVGPLNLTVVPFPVSASPGCAVPRAQEATGTDPGDRQRVLAPGATARNREGRGRRLTPGLYPRPDRSTERGGALYRGRCAIRQTAV